VVTEADYLALAARYSELPGFQITRELVLAKPLR
jgi:hypothetical protein